jgi:hypothetical protein
VTENVIQEIDLTVKLKVRVIGNVDASIESLLGSLAPSWIGDDWTCIGCGPSGTYGYTIIQAEEE